MENTRAKSLIKKYIAGTCTAEEQAIVESWYEKTLSTREVTLAEPDYDSIEEEIWSKLSKQQMPVINIWPRIAIAASILMILSASAYFFWYYQPSQQQIAIIQKQDIPPGSNKAILTLNNGRQITLTGARKGILANQGNTKINKAADGEVIYNAPASGQDEVMYNTMTTPRGGQYHLVLADGTHVWLNAASSIKYPTAFTEDYREVTITGEVYFEVAHNPAKPFRVAAGNQTTEVLGTHFNINAYADEQIMKTTLLEGSIKVSTSGQVNLLKPGQQAQFDGNKMQVIDHANTEEAIAWKNGYFRFNNQNIRDIMSKLSRWYDIDVAYEGMVSNEGYYGTISRYKNISEVLEMLQQTKGVHFSIKGRRVTVIG
ncbi:FecR family protein [Mucilaginibacter polytrichastri]|uniref:FecR protein domain-containing protein n=1 Tax=Mucilaginibacter polytrichastri TaxID=1302689 RepID=A0A1Q5ZZ12_9SPHI|nr:FecR domain-containing protein [Mucilaginibacter polytrichastri]OKS87014.1 hypothetical protein RG47T_2472 [Mucilaginibacter polytrichastri]SFS85934.1 FecR family protein [Mucilaginibacter polytrichastri]